METQMASQHSDASRSAGDVVEQSMPAAEGLSRRGFLGQTGGVVAALATASVLSTWPLDESGGIPRASADSALTAAQARADQAYNVRVAAARTERARPLLPHPTNGDEQRYAGTYIANFSKGLPHNALGEVDPAAYAALLGALRSGRFAAFETLPLGALARLAGAQSAFAFALEGADSGQLATPPPPAFSSAEQATEMAEMYWYALARDVPLASYANDPLIANAAADLSRLSGFRGPTAGGAVTPSTIFRLGLAGEMIGPYVSQFQWLPVPYGTLPLEQRYPVAPPAEYMTAYADWLAVQNGLPTPTKPATAAATPSSLRYVITGRDVAMYLINDFTYQAYLNALLMLGGLGAPVDPGNPYTQSKTQLPIASFGTAFHGLDLVAKVANASLKPVQYQKWLVHRRLRPEAFGGRVHNHKTKAARYPIHPDLVSKSAVLEAVLQKHGSYLLPMPVPRGCPPHPSHPAAHAAITGACVTVLKAWFDESYVLPAPVVASADGQSLLPYKGVPLTVGGELNKLAANHCVGRSFGGFHFRSELVAGLRLGEAVAISILADERRTFHEPFKGFSLTTFDGTTITV